MTPNKESNKPHPPPTDNSIVSSEDSIAVRKRIREKLENEFAAFDSLQNKGFVHANSAISFEELGTVSNAGAGAEPQSPSLSKK